MHYFIDIAIFLFQATVQLMARIGYLEMADSAIGHALERTDS